MATSLLSAASAASAGVHTNWAAVVVAILGSGLAGTVLGGMLAHRRELAAARRERYAAASRLLAARVEYPYRIRRRTNDAPATLDALVDRGHDLQERLADAHAWVTAECAVLGDGLGDRGRLNAPPGLERAAPRSSSNRIASHAAGAAIAIRPGSIGTVRLASIGTR